MLSRQDTSKPKTIGVKDKHTRCSPRGQGIALTPRADKKKSGARSIGENRERRSADTSNTYILAAHSPVFKPRSDLPHDNGPKDAG